MSSSAVIIRGAISAIRLTSVMKYPKTCPLQSYGAARLSIEIAGPVKPSLVKKKRAYIMMLDLKEFRKTIRNKQIAPKRHIRAHT